MIQLVPTRIWELDLQLGEGDETRCRCMQDATERGCCVVWWEMAMAIVRAVSPPISSSLFDWRNETRKPLASDRRWPSPRR